MSTLRKGAEIDSPGQIGQRGRQDGPSGYKDSHFSCQSLVSKDDNKAKGGQGYENR